MNAATSTGLTIVEQARGLMAEARSLSEVNEIRDKAEALRACTR